jgi:hypothetical protein
MKHEWFKPRHYKHFDVPVGVKFANGAACDPRFVIANSWLPLIHYIKREKRYKPKDGKTVFKNRDIMYASHKDACIIAKYAHELSARLDKYYEDNGLCDHVIAYRKLGKSNYHFSAEAYEFARANSPCIVLCFDITGFFNNLDHGILKERLKRVLGTTEIPADWYKVFRHVTRYNKVELADLAGHPTFGARMKLRTRAPIATIAELRSTGIAIHPNPSTIDLAVRPHGIPQGTPISSALSNLYMIDVDKVMSAICLTKKALYQRYSDDILIVCSPADEADITAALHASIENHKLKIKKEKTERVEFDAAKPKAFQYLGFTMSPDGATIRPGSLGRQWRKAKRSIRKTKRDGETAIRQGKATEIFTKKLRKKLSPVGVRNFSSYARKSAKAFGAKKIVKQVLRLERMVDEAIRELKP